MLGYNDSNPSITGTKVSGFSGPMKLSVIGSLVMSSVGAGALVSSAVVVEVAQPVRTSADATPKLANCSELLNKFFTTFSFEYEAEFQLV